MSANKTIRCISLIIEKVGRNQFPPFKEIQQFLKDHDYPVSDRTLQRYFQQIRDEFDISITYNQSKNGYFINKEESLDMDRFFSFLEIVNTAELLTESLIESRDILNYISFETQGKFRGVEYLKTLLRAIKNNRKITFTHENFETGKHRKYSLKPYLIKEYQNRWYLVGVISGINEFRTFGIDRINNLEISDKTFAPVKDFDAATLFNNTIGLTYSLNQLEEIILSFTPLQGKYIKTLPLHQSQEIVIEDENELQIKIKIIPNYEFVQRILMLGSNVKVLQPQWLVADVKWQLKESLKQYENE